MAPLQATAANDKTTLKPKSNIESIWASVAVQHWSPTWRVCAPAPCSELLQSEAKRAPSVTQQHFQRLPSVKNKRAGGRPTRSCSELPPVSTARLSAVVWGNWSSPPGPLLSTGHSLRNATGNARYLYRR